MNHTFDPSMRVSDEQMKQARENRMIIQMDLIERYRTPLIHFTLNIPGHYKVFGRMPEIFEEGCRRLRQLLEQEELPLIYEELIQEKTGYEALFCVDEKPEKIKQILLSAEETLPLGRLYDFDVICMNGEKLSRRDLKLPPRTCPLCGRPVQDCDREGRHSIYELVEHFKERTGESIHGI